MDDELQPLDIDDRSGGEKLLASGRVGLARLGEFVEAQRFDSAALLWMIFTLLIVGAQIYQDLDFGRGIGQRGRWATVEILSRSGGIFLAVACLAGVALATVFAGATARLARWLAVAAGAWIVVAGVLQIAVAYHVALDSSGEIGGITTSTFSNKTAGSIIGLADVGLGLVVVAVAWRFAASENVGLEVS